MKFKANSCYEVR